MHSLYVQQYDRLNKESVTKEGPFLDGSVITKWEIFSKALAVGYYNTSFPIVGSQSTQSLDHDAQSLACSLDERRQKRNIS
jgi:hypothetical protein